jgi:hypothetical protein
LEGIILLGCLAGGILFYLRIVVLLDVTFAGVKAIAAARIFPFPL